jgi:hypothetical protein
MASARHRAFLDRDALDPRIADRTSDLAHEGCEPDRAGLGGEAIHQQALQHCTVIDP